MARDAIDLLAFDRDVRRAAGRIEQLRGWLAMGTKEARDHARAFDPFDGVRHTATMSSYKSLVEQTPSILDVPLRDALLRWVHELLQVRVGHDLVLADADAAHALDPRLAPSRLALAEKAAALRDASGDADPALLQADIAAHTYAGAYATMIAAPDTSRAAAALERAGDLAAPVAAVRKERRERRFEAARRLGLAHPYALATKSDVGALARSFLDASEPLAVELLKVARKTSEGRWYASSAMQSFLARDAREGWPAYLTQRWLDDVFKALAPRGADAGKLPEALGGASFLRAATTWGYAWKTAGAPRSMPFALARDPYPAPAFRFGFAMAHAVAEPEFQKRLLELPARLAKAQARVLRGTMFHEARMIAARALFATEEHVTPSLFEEIGARLFGAPLPASMRDAWPDPRTSDPSRLLALLGTRAFLAHIVDRYDDDWFRNPKAGTHLTSLACGPAFDGDALPDGAVMATARAFEEALG
ncbi:MAG: hypothetical protein QOI41_67 [Myxococcales bacterium]|jgi:hypothetical protein|nr:hypothetical protein [Myxococcales bacterium]